MSVTYITAITQFLIVLGLITTEEAKTIEQGIVALIALGVLIGTLWGRYRAGGVNIWGQRT